MWCIRALLFTIRTCFPQEYSLACPSIITQCWSLSPVVYYVNQNLYPLQSYYPTLHSRRCDQVGFISPLCSIITQAILVIRTVSPFIVSHAHKGRVQYCCSCSNVYVFSQSQIVSAIRGLLYEAEVWFHVKMCRAQTSGEYIWFGCNCKTFHVCCMYTVVGGYSWGASECSSCYIYLQKIGWMEQLFICSDWCCDCTEAWVLPFLMCGGDSIGSVCLSLSARGLPASSTAVCALSFILLF